MSASDELLYIQICVGVAKGPVLEQGRVTMFMVWGFKLIDLSGVGGLLLLCLCLDA